MSHLRINKYDIVEVGTNQEQDELKLATVLKLTNKNNEDAALIQYHSISGDPEVVSVTSLKLHCSTEATSEQLNTFVKMIFRRAFNMGTFFDSSSKTDKGAWSLMLSEIEVDTLQDDVKPMFLKLIEQL